jgi:sporulation protein YlmC with PRC-barrel domain
MIQTKVVSEMWSIPVYTDSGDYFGEVEDAILDKNKVMGWKVVATQHSPIFKVLRGARGVIVPHQHVRAVGDIMIISRSVIPSVGERTAAVEMEQLEE